MDQSTAEVSAYLSRVATALALLDVPAIASVARGLVATHERGGTIYLCGNGGSAAAASHMAVDLGKGPPPEMAQGLRTFSLVDNVALMTAWANDAGYECVFAEQVRALGRPGDALVAISASGNSPNIVMAAEQARKQGMTVIGLCGFGGGKLAQLADHAVVVASHEYGPVEDLHMVLNHALASVVRVALRSGGPSVAAVT